VQSEMDNPETLTTLGKHENGGSMIDITLRRQLIIEHQETH